MSKTRAAHTLRRVGRRQGLPNAQVHDVVEDTDGLIWAAGPGGLARYDGVRVQAYGRESGLRTHGLRSIGAADDGSIWIGSDLGLELRGADGVIRPVGRAWQFGFVERIAVGSGGAAWIATVRGLVSVDANLRVEAVEDPRVADQLVDDVGVDALGRVVALVDGVVWRRDDDGWVEISRGLGECSRATAFSLHPSGITIGGAGVLIELDHSASLVDWIEFGGAPVTAVVRVGPELWTAHGPELSRFVRSDAQTWERAEVLCSGVSVNRLSVDRSGNVWAATNSDGLLVFSALHPAVQPRDLGSGAVLSIRCCAGETLIGTDGNAWHGADGRIEAEPGLHGERVWDFISDEDGVRWAATQDGLQRCKSGQWGPVLRDVPAVAAPGRCLLERGAELWVGSVVGLTAIGRRDALLSSTPQGAEDLGYVYSMTECRDRSVRVGTIGNGLWRLAEGASGFAREGMPHITADSNVYSVTESSDGRVFVGADDKVLVRERDSRWRVLASSREAVFAWALLWTDGRLWVGSGSGLVELDPRSGAVRRTVSAFLDEAAWEFTTSRTLLRDPSGSLLCGTSGGLLDVFPDHLSITERPTALLTDTRWMGAQPIQSGRTFALETGKWSVEFDLGAAWFSTGDLRFRYRLIGFSNQWQDARGARIQFNSLPPGDYKLEAVATTCLSGDGPIQHLASLEVRAPWWAPTWLGRPAEATSALLDRLTGSNRNKALLAQNRDLEQRVRARTADLDRSNAQLAATNAQLQTLTVTDALTGAYNRRWFDRELPRIFERCRRESRSLSLLLIDVDLFKAYNDAFGHLLGDRCLVDVVRAISNEVRPATDSVVRYGGEEFAVVLSSTTSTVGQQIADRVRLGVWEAAIKHNVELGRVTVSVGGATVAAGSPMPASVDASSIIARADAALYLAKAEGRNRVEWDQKHDRE